MDIRELTSGVHNPAPQRGGAWHEERCGALTASKLNDAFDMRKDGKPGAKRTNLIKNILVERMTGYVADNYMNSAMQWGIEQEDAAKQSYSESTGNQVDDCGFFRHPTIEFLGASPDGLIGADGLVELKCPTSTTHLEYLMSKECPDQYKDQMTLQLVCTGRQWCDFVTFDPRFPGNKQIKIWRFEPTQEQRDELVAKCVAFLGEVDSLFDALEDTAA